MILRSNYNTTASFDSALAEVLLEPEPLNAPAFITSELQSMHRYCLKYRDLVRGGGTPTKEQDDKFIAYQKVCYGEGVALGG